MGRRVEGTKGKSTEKDHLEQVAKQLGKDLSELEESNAEALFPDLLSHLWSVFSEIHSWRTYGMSGPNPISGRDIIDWSSINGISLTPWEVSVIKSLDTTYLNISYEEKS